MWYTVHRPDTFKNVVGQFLVKKCLQGMVVRDYVPGAILLSGGSGLGKTLLARIFSRALNCEHPDPESRPCNDCDTCILHKAEADSGFYLEVDCGSRGSVADIRELKDAMYYKSRRYKIVLLDEAHLMEAKAQGALLKQIEEAPNGIVYILATTNPEKLLDTIHTRVFDMELQSLLPEELVVSLKLIATAENLDLSDETFLEVAKAAKGSARDAVKRMEQLYVTYGNGFVASQVKELFGAHMDKIILDFIYKIRASDKKDDLYQDFHFLVSKINPFYLMENIFQTLSSLFRVHFGFVDSVSPDLLTLYMKVSRMYGDDLFKLLKFFNDPTVSKFYSLEALYSSFIYLKHTFGGFSVLSEESIQSKGDDFQLSLERSRRYNAV